MTRAWHHHESDMPTYARAILHYTDQKGPNILKGSVVANTRRLVVGRKVDKYPRFLKITLVSNLIKTPQLV